MEYEERRPKAAHQRNDLNEVPRQSTLRSSRRRAAEQYAGQRVLTPKQPPFRVSDEARNRATVAMAQAKAAAEIRQMIADIMQMATSKQCPFWKIDEAARGLSLRCKEIQTEFEALLDALEEVTA